MDRANVGSSFGSIFNILVRRFVGADEVPGAPLGGVVGGVLGGVKGKVWRILGGLGGKRAKVE